MHFVNIFDQLLEEITSEQIPAIIWGDIDIDVKPTELLKSKDLNDKEANGFKMISNEAARVTHISRTCKDYVITQNIECNVNVLKKQSISDHEALLVTWIAHATETNLWSYRDFSFLKKSRYIWTLLNNDFTGAIQR